MEEVVEGMKLTHRGVYIAAEEYLDAADMLSGSEAHQMNRRFFGPVYFLYGHGVELLFKSYLMNQGKSLSEMHSHNLEYLHSMCSESLSLSSEMKDVLSLLNDFFVRRCQWRNLQKATSQN
jgi:hypothetical protein